jgi:hypothetical protein
MSKTAEKGTSPKFWRTNQTKIEEVLLVWGG